MLRFRVFDWSSKYDGSCCAYIQQVSDGDADSLAEDENNDPGLVMMNTW